MLLNLLDSFGKRGVDYGLYTKQADVIDTDYLSRYFVVSEFNPILTAGKNAISINGSPFLSPNSQILMECLDAVGNVLYVEMAKYSDDGTPGNTYKESTSTIISIYVYNDTVDGVGKLTLWGTLTNGQTVKWTQNVIINKTLKNSSKVRFYQTPTFQITSDELPVLNQTVSQNLLRNQSFTGSINGFAVTPVKNTNQSTINASNIDIDYRLTLMNTSITNLTPDTSSFNSQMIGSIITLNINTIQSPSSIKNIPVSQTASYVIKNVINNNTIQIDTPYYYLDGLGNSTITNIINANFSIEYLYVNYYNSSSTYQTTNIGGTTYTIQQSYADVVYNNIRTFSGYVARHKIYRKSLSSNEDYSIIADEPIKANQLLIDDLTQNKYYNLLGSFYNQNHIAKYWFTSSNNLSMTYTPTYAVDSMLVSSSYPLSGSDYLMVKVNTAQTNRNAIYVPFDVNQFSEQSGSAYDSNFMEFNANVQYIIDVSTVIQKKFSETNAKLILYITSSSPGAKQESSYTPNFGVKIAEIDANQTGSISDFTDSYTFYTPMNNFYGTLVIVPTLCNVTLKNVSINVYGDDGFSPDIYSTKILWPVNVANETFEIKSELFDINNNLIYSDFNLIQNFDPSGSTVLLSNNQVLPTSSSIHNLTPFIQTGSMYYYRSGSLNFLYIYSGLKWVSASLY